MRLNIGETLDKNHMERIESERKKWIDILHRIMDIILFWQGKISHYVDIGNHLMQKTIRGILLS